MKLMSKFNVCVVGAIMIGFITESVEGLLFSQFTLFQVSLTNRAKKCRNSTNRSVLGCDCCIMADPI